VLGGLANLANLRGHRTREAPPRTAEIDGSAGASVLVRFILVIRNRLRGGAMASRLARVTAVTVNDVLEGHTLLEIDRVDRVHPTLSVPNLVVGGQVVSFLTAHENNPIPSPALLERRGQAFRRAVSSFAEATDIPLPAFAGKKSTTRPGVLAESPWPERKIDQVMPLMRKAQATGRSPVVAIGVAQEYQRVFTGTKDQTPTGAVWFSCHRTERRVTCSYFYPWDAGFGPASIKICAYFPYPGKIWFNGHEWAKRQARKAGLAVNDLSNGFASGEDPAALQQICDRLGPGQIRSTTKGVFRTAVDRDTDGVVLNAFYRHSRIKTHPKDGRAPRIETVINDTYDIGVPRRIAHFDEPAAKARDVNRRLLETMRAGRGCVPASPALERVARPALTEDGRRAPALRFGASRVMALTGALSLTLFGTCGITNKSPRAVTARLLGTPDSASQMTYDLRRLRLNGLIHRIEHTHTYVPTPEGRRIAIFYTKLYNRLLRPLAAADQPQAPPELRQALTTIDHQVEDYITRARLKPAA
jgi:hypothetical protein